MTLIEIELNIIKTVIRNLCAFMDGAPPAAIDAKLKRHLQSTLLLAIGDRDHLRVVGMVKSEE